MIRRAMAVRFDRKTENGRTEPLRVTVETQDGSEHDAVMKVSNGPECSIESLANEMLGSMLAADLGLPVNEPFLVEIDDAFTNSVPSPTVRSRLQASCKVAFASKNAGKQWRRWQSSDKVAVTQRATALAILAFDGFMANSDRSPTNPNLLVNDIDWRLIDHESAFGFRMKLFPRCQPWVVGNLELLRRYGERSEHIFVRHLIGCDGLDFAAARATWSGLTDARIAQYDASLPDEWSIARPFLTEAFDHIKIVRDRVDLCLLELERVLK